MSNNPPKQPDVIDEAPIEPPHIEGNYSARTSNKWVVEGKPLEGSMKFSGKHQDEIHTTISPFKISPGQLYSTSSGQMFHAGKVLICLCGLPGRGKTHLSVSLTRYLRWLGVSTQSFHFDDFRRQYLTDKKISPSFFSQRPDDEELYKFKENLIQECIGGIADFFENNLGQVAIYDAINGVAKQRIELQKKFSKIDVKVLFIESLIENEALLANSLKEAIKSPDYEEWNVEAARVDFTNRIAQASTYYEVINEVDTTEKNQLIYIKSINFGERLVLNRSEYGYLTNRITFFLLNSRIKKGSIFFARCGDSLKSTSYKLDPPLSEDGVLHSKKLLKTLTKYLHKEDLSQKLLVWTSTRRRTIETVAEFKDKYHVTVVQRSELTQINPGLIEGLSPEEIKTKFPIEQKLFENDPYHARFPRAESYHDVAVRLEPLIMEMERNTKNILVIGHESVLKVLYGYLMSFSSNDIPYLKFPQDEIIEVRYNAYANITSRIKLQD